MHIAHGERRHAYVNAPNITFSLSQLRSEGGDVKQGVTRSERAEEARKSEEDGSRRRSWNHSVRNAHFLPDSFLH